MHCSLIPPEREPALEQTAITDLPFPATAMQEEWFFPGAPTVTQESSEDRITEPWDGFGWKEP